MPRRSPAPPASLCGGCVHRRIITSGRGSQFLLCQAAARDDRIPKYPPQPVLRCPVFDPEAAAESTDN